MAKSLTRVLVLGSTGMLGHMMMKTLRPISLLEVYGTQRTDPPDSLHLDAETGLEGVRLLLRRSGGFDYLINCIGMTKVSIDEQDPVSVRRAYAVNGSFPHELAMAASELGGRVIHVSTDGVFADEAGLCFEDTPTQPSDVYGETKVVGELSDEHAITLRCSIVGPDPVGRRGLLEWFLAQPDGVEVSGYADHRWSGVTSLQLAELCREIIVTDAFRDVRAESPVHHVCPNAPVSKYDLLVQFATTYGKNVAVAPITGPPPKVTRELGTHYGALRPLYGENFGIEGAVKRLATITG